MNQSLIYVLLIIAYSCFRYAQSTPTFTKEYVHIKVHLPVEVRHEAAAEVTHSKHKHQHRYHKRRRPVQEYHGAKHSSGPQADDYLEALILSTVMKPLHHHDADEKYLMHAAEHVEPVDEYIVHHEHPRIPEHDIDDLEDFRYRQLHDHDDVGFGHQSYYRPKQYDDIIKLVKPNYKHMPTVSFKDDSNLETETFKFHHITKPYHQAEIEEELEATKSQLRPSAYEDSTLRYASNLSSDEDFHYQQKPEEADDFLEIAAIHQSDLLKNNAQKFKSHHHEEPISIEYIYTNPPGDIHQSHDEYMTDYEGKVRQVAEYPSTEGGKEISIYKHSDFDEFSGHKEHSSHNEGFRPVIGLKHSAYDEFSSHKEHSSPTEGFRPVTGGGAVADLPFKVQSDHHDAETYSDTDDYSATHVQGVGRGSGYQYGPTFAKIKKLA